MLRLSQSRYCPAPAPRHLLQFHTSLKAQRSLLKLPTRAVLLLYMGKLGCC